MLCLLYLFLIVLGGLLHKTVEQQNLLSLYNIIMVYRKKNRPILVAYRYTQFIEIRINQFLDHLGVYNLHLGYHKQKLPNLLLDIIQQGLEKLIESFGSVNLPHTAKVINLLQSAELIPWQMFASNLFRQTSAGLLCINWDAARISRENHLEPAIIDYQVVS